MHICICMSVYMYMFDLSFRVSGIGKAKSWLSNHEAEAYTSPFENPGSFPLVLKP